MPVPPENKAEAGNYIGKEELRPAIVRGSGTERGPQRECRPYGRQTDGKRKGKAGPGVFGPDFITFPHGYAPHH